MLPEPLLRALDPASLECVVQNLPLKDLLSLRLADPRLPGIKDETRARSHRLTTILRRQFRTGVESMKKTSANPDIVRITSSNGTVWAYFLVRIPDFPAYVWRFSHEPRDGRMRLDVYSALASMNGRTSFKDFYDQAPKPCPFVDEAPTVPVLASFVFEGRNDKRRKSFVLLQPDLVLKRLRTELFPCNSRV